MFSEGNRTTESELMILRTEKIHDFKYELFKLLLAMKFKSVPVDLFLNYFYLHGR